MVLVSRLLIVAYWLLGWFQLDVLKVHLDTNNLQVQITFSEQSIIHIKWSVLLIESVGNTTLNKYGFLIQSNIDHRYMQPNQSETYVIIYIKWKSSAPIKPLFYTSNTTTRALLVHADVKPSGNGYLSGSEDRSLRQAYKTAEWKPLGLSTNTKWPPCNHGFTDVTKQETR